MTKHWLQAEVRREIVTSRSPMVELYRRAQPLWNARFEGKLTDEEYAKAREATQAFDRATGRKPCEHSLLSPRSDDDPLRSALLAKVSGVEAAVWRRNADKWWKKRDAEMAQEAAASHRLAPKRLFTAARRKLKLPPLP